MVVDNSPTDDRIERLDILDLLGRNREIVAVQNHHVGEIADLDRTFGVFLERRIRTRYVGRTRLAEETRLKCLSMSTVPSSKSGPEVQNTCPQLHAPDFRFDGQLAYAQ